MARQSLPEDLKRKQIAVRLGPQDRDRVARLAAEHGNSLGSEVEQLALDQLAYVEGCDAETRQLLESIAVEIAAISKETGKRWHKDRKTWAAVAEMLQRGPIADLDPDDPRNDDPANEAWSRLFAIEEEKKSIAVRLRELGVSVTAEHPSKRKTKPMGLLGLLTQPNALNNFTIRDTERVAIDALPDGPNKEQARNHFSRILELDEQEQAADADWTEKLRPFWDARAQGREVYRTLLKRRAERRRDEGKPYNYSHLLGWFD